MTRTEIEKVHRKIAEYIRRHPELTFSQMAKETGISLPMISLIAIRYGMRRRSAADRYSPTNELSKVLDT